MSDCSGCVHQDYSAGNKKTGRISDRLKGTPESKPRKSSPMRATDLPVHWGSVCLETQCAKGLPGNAVGPEGVHTRSHTKTQAVRESFQKDICPSISAHR